MSEEKRLVRIGPETHRRLKMAAARYERKMQEIVEEALAAYFSAHELVKDLPGVAELPEAYQTK